MLEEQGSRLAGTAALLREQLRENVKIVRAVARELEFDRDPRLEEREDGRANDLPLNVVEDLVAALDAVLVEGHFQEPPPSLEEGEFWSVDTLRLSGEPRDIVGGALVLVRSIPIVVPMSDLVIAYLTISGEDDLLQRERHSHFGWHYHYLDWRARRSDRILCWDARAKLRDHEKYPLFHERHAERNKFTARPDRWGPKKRRSMHDACRPDLGKWPLDEFRTASNGAEPVWPGGSILTARPTAARPGSVGRAQRSENGR